MDTTHTVKDSGRDLVIAMLEIALAKARDGQICSALLITLKPNGEADISGEFTHIADLAPAIKKLGEARRTLKEMAVRTLQEPHSAGH